MVKFQEAPGIVYRGQRVFIRLIELGDADLFAGWAGNFFLPAIAPVLLGI